MSALTQKLSTEDVLCLRIKQFVIMQPAAIFLGAILFDKLVSGRWELGRYLKVILKIVLHSMFY